MKLSALLLPLALLSYPSTMIFTPLKLLTVFAVASQAMLASPAVAQAVGKPVCGTTGAANFVSLPELSAAVTCLTTLTGCNSTDLPVAARTDLHDLGALGVLLNAGVLDGALNGGMLDKYTLTSILGGLIGGGVLGGLLGGLLHNVNLSDLVDDLLEIVRQLLHNLLGTFGTSIGSWCVESLSSFDNLFAGLTVSS
jgi:hypothetical protein